MTREFCILAFSNRRFLILSLSQVLKTDIFLLVVGKRREQISSALSHPTIITLSGDHRWGETHVPIPNTTVKPPTADGNVLLWDVRVGYCQIYDPLAPKEPTGLFLELIGDETLTRSATQFEKSKNKLALLFFEREERQKYNHSFLAFLVQ